MKNRYTVVKICENCVFPQGLYRLRDKETGWKIIIEDKKDVNCIKDYLISKDEQIRSLEEQLKNSITPKFKIGEYLYSVRPFCGKILCAEGYVTSITQLSDKTIHYHLETKPNELGYKNQYGVEETNCYRTMEEVHKISSKLLAELEGK